MKSEDRLYFVFVMFCALCLLAGALLGCQPMPPAQEGGKATTRLGGFSSPASPTPPPATATGTAATLQQSQNPAAVSSQTVKRQESRQEASPVPVTRITETPTPAGVVTVTEHFGQPPLVHTVSEESATVIGPSWYDNAREIAAKMAGNSGVRAYGFALIVAALVCCHPVARKVVGGGKTVPALAAAAGFALIFGGQLIAGHEALALVLIAAGLGIAFLVARLNYKEGQADTLQSSSQAAR